MNMLITKDIKLLVVHCSDTKDSENLGAIDLHKMHLKFGWDTKQLRFYIVQKLIKRYLKIRV
ncbi:hypothetical protein OAE14_00155 [Alphaproteobacteria bacterium]|nr:hypothetical protein [Alphaproteobacteria bacterium]